MTTSLPSVDDDLLAWLHEREVRYEVLDGVVVVSPPDRLAHADRVFGLAAALRAAAPEELMVVGPSYGVYYDRAFPDSFVMPDALVARREDCEDDGIRVAPLLVVEVLSRSTRRRDLGEKRQIYAELGVPHYWLIDPEQHRATVLRRGGDGYREVSTAVGELVVDEPFGVRVPL